MSPCSVSPAASGRTISTTERACSVDSAEVHRQNTRTRSWSSSPTRHAANSAGSRSIASCASPSCFQAIVFDHESTIRSSSPA